MFPELTCHLVFEKGGHFRDIGRAFEALSLRPGEARDLGDIPSKKYGDE